MGSFTVAINAGGQSSRMGTDKAFVLLAERPMIAHVLERVSNLGQDETILITNRPNDYAQFSLPMFADVLPGNGALGGIYTALHYSKHEYTLMLACDMPFVNSALLNHMLRLRSEEMGPYDVIVPLVNDYPEGLHAIYRKSCLSPIQERLEANRLKVVGFYDQVRVRYLTAPEYSRFDPQELSFRNINTPDELASAQPPAGEA